MVVAFESYDKVISQIEGYRGSSISIPKLSQILGVKTTTLNARFRRQRVEVRTIGRTNYVPCDQALRLAELHKYALLGWPTLQEASRMTDVKDATIKARCEKGKVEGYLDLTKRLRINPIELGQLSSEFQKLRCRQLPGYEEIVGRAEPQRAHMTQLTTTHTSGISHRPVKRHSVASSGRLVKKRVVTTDQKASTSSFVIPPASEPKIVFITKKDHDLSAAKNEWMPDHNKLNLHVKQSKRSGSLDYDPDRPFCVSDCCVGKTIRYGQFHGTVMKIIDDAFNPKIKVAFPVHPEPLMREVLLLVERRRK